MSQPVQLSVVSPVYQAQPLIRELVTRIKQALAPLTDEFEIILVEDGGTDGSWQEIHEQWALDSRVRGIRLSRNFGQHRAITAGLAHARGEWIVVMDCDLQDQPEEIPALWQHARQGGFDSVAARRTERRDAAYKSLLSHAFYRVLSARKGIRYDPSIANFGIYHRKVIAAVLAMHDSIRYFPTMVRWVGFRAGALTVAHAPRPVGRSSYSLRRLLGLAADVVLAYSDQPLRLLVWLGLLISGGALLLVPVVGYAALTGRGWPLLGLSLLLSVWFLSGLLLAALGLVGLYVGKTFEQVKGRPLYLVAETLGEAPAPNLLPTNHDE